MAKAMQFEWDEANTDHIRRHMVTPEEAEQAFANDPIELAAVNRKGETRRLTVGPTDAGRLLAVASTQRKSRIRIVTAHPANRKQRRIYEENKSEG